MIHTTTKTSIILIHAVHLVLRWGLIAFAVLCFIAVLWLIHGLSIDRLEIGGYKVEKLYLKLDKKLSLQAKRIVLPKRKQKPSFSNVDKTFDNLRYMLALFHDIALQEIDFKNNRYAFFYGDDILYIHSNEYEIAGKLDRQASKLVAHVIVLFVPKYNLELSGDLTYDYAKRLLEAQGEYRIETLTGKFRAIQRRDRIVFALNGEAHESIRPLVQRFKLPKSIETWIVDKVRAKQYRIDYLKGAIEITRNGALRFVSDELEAKATLTQATVRFHKKVPAAHARKLTVTFSHHMLSFTMQKPRYLGRPLDGTTVNIRHLGDGKVPTLTLRLRAQTDIEDEVQKIIKAYGLTIPIRHNGRHNQLELTLHIPLKRGAKKIRAKLDARLDHGMLSIGSFRLPVCGGGKIRYEGDAVEVKDVCIEDWWYEGTVNGTIDVHKKRAVMEVHLKRLAIGPKTTPFFVLKDRLLKVMIGYEQSLSVDIPSLGLRVENSHPTTRFEIKDLARLKPFVRYPIFDAKGGHITFTTKDGETFDFKGKIEKQACIFFGDNDVCYRFIPIFGHFDGKAKRVLFQAFDGRLTYDSAKHRVTVKDLGIDLKRLLQLRRKFEAKKNVTSETLIVQGYQSDIRYERYRLLTDRYTIKLFKNGDIQAQGSLDGDKVTFARQKGRFYVTADRIRDKMLHPLINFNGLKGGRYSLQMSGDPDNVWEGTILVEGGTLRDFKAYNNTLAFLNAIPALATLQRPGFSQKGFTVDEGIVLYRIEHNRLVRLENVFLKGKTATIVGKGTIDMQSGAIDVDLAIRTIKDFAKIVGNIPVVGYLLLGEDKSVTVGLKVTGTLQDPKVETSVVKDIVTMPLRVLERIITAPKLLERTPKLPDLPPLKNEKKPTAPDEVKKSRTNAPAMF